MANDMMDTLRGLLGDNADEKIQSVLSSLQGNSSTTASNSAPLSTETDFTPLSEEPSILPNLDMSQLQGLMKQIGGASDSRSSLLLSLKPYMRESRRSSIDNAIRLLNLTRFSGFFK